MAKGKKAPAFNNARVRHDRDGDPRRRQQQHRRKKKEGVRLQRQISNASGEAPPLVDGEQKKLRRRPPGTTSAGAKRKPQGRKTVGRKPRQQQQKHNSQVTHVRVSGLEWNRSSKNAIRGYVHIPAGIPFMTRNCKALALERKRPVYYYVKPSAPKKRLGIQVPKEVFDEVHAKFVSSAEDRKQLRDKRDTKIAEEASVRLKQLFPHIPNSDAAKIIERGWERYTGRVGRENSLSLDSKLLLATWAYIRHSRTDYDEQLGPRAAGGPASKQLRDKIRKDVRGSMLSIWKGWGGDLDMKLLSSIKKNGKTNKAPRIDPVSGISVGRNKHDLLAGALQRSRNIEQQETGSNSISKEKAKENTLPRNARKPTAAKDGPAKSGEKIQLHGKLPESDTLNFGNSTSTRLMGQPASEAIVIDSDPEEDIWDQIIDGDYGDDNSSHGWSEDDEFTIDSDEDDENEHEYEDEDEDEDYEDSC